MSKKIQILNVLEISSTNYLFLARSDFCMRQFAPSDNVYIFCGVAMNRLVVVGARIEEERKRLGWATQEIAGFHCGVSRITWGKYERGDAEMNMVTMKRFIEAGADFDYIETGFHQKEFERMEQANGPSYLSLPATIQLRDRMEQDVVEAMRLDSRVAKFFWKIACSVKMANFDMLENSGILMCRSFIENRELSLVKIEFPSAVNERERDLIASYRRCRQTSQQLMRAACDAESELASDTTITADGFTGLECRMMNFFRESTERGKQIIEQIALLDAEKNSRADGAAAA